MSKILVVPTQLQAIDSDKNDSPNAVIQSITMAMGLSIMDPMVIPTVLLLETQAKAQADWNQAPKGIHTVTAPFETGDRHFAYIEDHVGVLAVVDLSHRPYRARSTQLRVPILSGAVRSNGSDVSPVITNDKALRTVMVNGPSFVETGDGRKVFGRYPDLRTVDTETWNRLFASYGPVVDDFYTVVDGGAFRVGGLDGLVDLDNATHQRTTHRAQLVRHAKSRSVSRMNASLMMIAHRACAATKNPVSPRAMTVLHVMMEPCAVHTAQRPKRAPSTECVHRPARSMRTVCLK